MAKPIALQLYSVREAAAADPIGTLKKVAETGYVGVEPAGMHGMKPAEFAKLIADLGMRVCSSHASMPERENLSALVEEQQALGNTMVVSGFGPPEFATADKVKAAAAAFQEGAQLLEPYGMKLGVHNHWWEFSQKVGRRNTAGRCAYDLFMELAPDVFSELDVYWTAYGWADPVQVLSQHKARVPLLHAKDGALEEDKPQTAVGSGALDMPAIIGAADPNVLQWVIVELDHCATDMMEAVRESYRYLTSKGLAQGRK